MQKLLIKEKDYENYEFPLSYSALFGKKLKQAVYEKLEKLHPCFSERDYFESRVKLGKKGFTAFVTVMDKVKLAEYRYSNPGKKLFCEAKGKKYEVGSKGNPVIFILIVFIVSVFLSGTAVYKKRVSDKKIAAEIHEKILKEEKVEEVGTDNEKYMELLDQFLIILTAKKGKISSFSFSNKEKNFFAKFFIKGIYPEEFGSLFSETEENGKLSFSEVKFDGNEPEYSVSIDVLKKGNNQNALVNKYVSITRTEDFSQVRKKIRELIKDEKGILHFEKVIPFEMNFEISKKKWKSFFEKAEQILKKEGFNIGEFSVEENSSSGERMQVQMQFNLNEENNMELMEIIGNMALFFEEDLEKKGVSESVKILKSEMTEKNGKNMKGTDKKIGEIIHQNGEKILFYLSSEGKIYRKTGAE